MSREEWLSLERAIHLVYRQAQKRASHRIATVLAPGIHAGAEAATNSTEEGSFTSLLAALA